MQADTEPLCLGHCAKQLVWDFWVFLHLKNNCIVWGPLENPNLSQTCQTVQRDSLKSPPPLLLEAEAEGSLQGN